MPVHTMQAEWRFLNFELYRDKWLQIAAALQWGKSPRYQPKRRLGGTQSHSGTSGEHKNLLCFAGN